MSAKIEFKKFLKSIKDFFTTCASCVEDTVDIIEESLIQKSTNSYEIKFGGISISGDDSSLHAEYGDNSLNIE